MANNGEQQTQIAAWSEIDSDSRLRIPTEISSQTMWCIPGHRCDALIELREKGVLIIHDGRRVDDIEEQCRELFEELADKVEALRRAALSRAIYIPASIGKTNRRVTLSAQVLAHLGVTKLARVLCLAYSAKIEVISEARVAELFEAVRLDINLD